MRTSIHRTMLGLLGAAALLGGSLRSTRADDLSYPTKPQDSDSATTLMKRQTLSLDIIAKGGASFALTPPATTPFRNAAVGATPVLVRASAGSIYGWNIINPNASPVYVKTYDSASPTVGTTTPLSVYAIPANGVFFLSKNGLPHGTYSTAISVAAVAGLADNSTAAPTTGVFVQAAVGQ